jgi:hypothetical protein
MSSSNLGQNYPYSSESESERAATLDRTLTAHPDLAQRVQSESIPGPREPRSWVWKCPTPACAGLLHAAGFARNVRAVYTVCDTCGQTYLR